MDRELFLEVALVCAGVAVISFGTVYALCCRFIQDTAP